MNEQEWVNPQFRFGELCNTYSYELDQYIQQYEGYTPDQARSVLVSFFDSVGKGEEVRRLLNQLGR